MNNLSSVGNNDGERPEAVSSAIGSLFKFTAAGKINEQEGHFSMPTKGQFCMPIDTKRGPALPGSRLAAIPQVPIRRSLLTTLDRLLLDRRQDLLNYPSDDHVSILLKSAQKTVESQTSFWYLISQDDANFEFVHRATTSNLRFDDLFGFSMFSIYP